MTRRGSRHHAGRLPLMRPVWATTLVAAAVLVALASLPAVPRATAQTPTATPAATSTGAPTGRISGTITDGTAGAALPDNLSIMLIELNGNTITGSHTAQVTNGAYSFAVAPDPSASYVLRLEYEGVPYFPAAIQLSPGQPTAQRDVTVYETTTTAPALTIQSTTVTLVAIDRTAGTLTLLREDLVRNPTDRVYVGANGGPTLRVPAPDGATAAGGLTADDVVTLDGGVATVTTPLTPGVTSVVTRYTVGYDRASDRYRLRVTAPVQADRIEARAPATFVEAMDPVGDAQRAPDAQVSGEQLLVVGRDNTAPGQGLLVELVGLSGAKPATNPLTDRPGVAFGAALALIVLAGVAFGLDRWRVGSAAP